MADVRDGLGPTCRFISKAGSIGSRAVSTWRWLSAALPPPSAKFQAVGLGASFSNVAGGYIVQTFGYPAGFLSLAMVALVALAFFWALMPETRDAEKERPGATRGWAKAKS